MLGNLYPDAGPLDGTEYADVWQSARVRRTTLANVAALAVSGAPGVGYTAAGASAVRSAITRSSDCANVLDYGAGLGGDDAAAFRAALASGKSFILVPPGTYVFKSLIPPSSPVVYQNPAGVVINGLQNVHFFMYGAKLLIDSSVSGPNAYMSAGSSHFLIQGDSKNVGIYGGELVGNRTGLPSGTLNNGITITSGTQVTIRDVKLSGDYSNGSALNGTFIFDTLFDNVWIDNAALGFDLAHYENLTIRGARIFADQAIAGATGIKTFWDAATLTDNVATAVNGTRRNLRNVQANNLQIVDCLIQGYPTGIFLEGMEGARVSGNMIRDGVTLSNVNNYAGIVVAGSSAAAAAGRATRAVSIAGNDIFNNGNTGTAAGAGVIVAPGAGAITGLSIRANRIHDNTTKGITQTSVTGLTGLVVSENDFGTTGSGSAPQSTAIDAGLLAAIGSAATVRSNTGFNPTGVAANRSLPGAVGVGNTAVNSNQFPCVVYITNSSATASFPRYLRAGQPSGDPIAVGGIANGAMVTLILLPGDGIYFDTALPSAWEWFGL